MRICVLLLFCLVLGSLYAQKEVVRKEKNVTVYLDRTSAVKTYVYSDGRELSVDLTGKTPYGTSIDEITRPVQKEPVPVTLVFSARDSDEDMDDELRALFDDIYGSLRARVGGSRYDGDDELRVIVSFCRYGEYGFCFKKRNAVVVRFREGDKTLHADTFNSVYLGDKKKRVRFVQDVMKTYDGLRR